MSAVCWRTAMRASSSSLAWSSGRAGGLDMTSSDRRETDTDATPGEDIEQIDRLQLRAQSLGQSFTSHRTGSSNGYWWARLIWGAYYTIGGGRWW